MFWELAPDQLTLEPNHIHVWRIALDLPASRVDDLRALISRDELARADAFYFPEHRVRFIVAHASVRMILARYARRAPRDLVFATDAFGKPALVQPAPVLRFNLAHSEHLALCAITRDAPIGIDVELIKPLENLDELAARFFSPHEIAALRALSADQRTRGFYACWTRKEAYIKAVGKGLREPLDQFAVSLAPNEPARLLFARDDPHAAEQWSLFALEPAPGYIGASAIHARARVLQGWRLD
ncbi:MAG: 4'-phosphopantetheinyl transferase superfamily protein [Chloroflexi bacterium]|nr:4'-phosphopantetheinyl transferase superfamily protein [Chloroflexota bacterium]